jgi:hypothetical protein
MKRIILLALAICSATAIAKPVVNVSPNTKGGISKTVTETWNLTDDEKKNYAPQTMMMSQISATAIAPTATIKKGSWTAIHSEHRSCFYNTFGTTVEGRYLIKFNVAGKEVNAFDKVPVGGGQGFCVTRFLEIWVRGERPGDSPSVATTHVEMDGNSTDNEGHGTITVR